MRNGGSNPVLTSLTPHAQHPEFEYNKTAQFINTMVSMNTLGTYLQNPDPKIMSKENMCLYQEKIFFFTIDFKKSGW